MLFFRRDQQHWAGHSEVSLPIIAHCWFFSLYLPLAAPFRLITSFRFVVVSDFLNIFFVFSSYVFRNFFIHFSYLFCSFIAFILYFFRTCFVLFSVLVPCCVRTCIVLFSYMFRTFFVLVLYFLSYLFRTFFFTHFRNVFVAFSYLSRFFFSLLFHTLCVRFPYFFTFVSFFFSSFPVLLLYFFRCNLCREYRNTVDLCNSAIVGAMLCASTKVVQKQHRRQLPSFVTLNRLHHFKHRIT